MKKYENYQESGVDWLGEIPAHWGITHLKRVTDFINGAAFKPEDWQSEGVPIVRIQNLNGNEVFNYIKPDQEIKDSCHLFGGELLFSWSGNVGTSFGPFMWEREGLAYLNQHIFKLDNYQLDKKYFYWLLRAVTKYIESKTHGIIGMVHVTKPEIGAVPIPNITQPEQRAIAAYLDRKTAQLDKLLAQKEALLQRLHQQRQALISEAVTKGLDPATPRKSSGVAWLGEVPAHWEVKRLKWATYRVTDGAHISPDRTSEDYPFVSTVDIKSGVIDFENCLGTTAESYSYLVKTGCQPHLGDVLYSKDGTVGRTAVIDFEREFVVASSLIIITPNQDVIDSQFMEFALQSIVSTNYVESLLSGTALRRISISKVENMPIVVPPITEQNQIVSWLKMHFSKLDNVAENIHTQIKVLKTYRQSLISDVVTGKVDVRPAAPAEQTSHSMVVGQQTSLFN